jgi:hypothetical protein
MKSSPPSGLIQPDTSMRVPALLACGVLSDAQFGSVVFNEQSWTACDKGKAPRGSLPVPDTAIAFSVELHGDWVAFAKSTPSVRASL